MKKQLKNPGMVEFTATIIDPGGGGAYVEFPFDTVTLFGTTGRVPIKVSFDGVPYQGSMLRMGTEKHIIIILKKIREEIQKQANDVVQVSLELDEDLRQIQIPADVQEALDLNQKAAAQFYKLSYTHQKEYVDWIIDSKKEETRQRRIEKMIQKLVGDAK